MKSILLFRLGGLGDLLVALPSFNLLRRAFPGARLDLVGRKDYGELLRDAGVIDAVFSADNAEWAPLFDVAQAVPESLRARLADYDLVLGWFLQKTGTHHFLRRKSDVSPSSMGKMEPSPLSSGPSSRAFIYDPDSRLTVGRFFFDRTAEFISGLEASSAPFEECWPLSLSANRPAEGRSSQDVLPSAAAGAPGIARGSTSAVLARGYKPRASGEPKARPLTVVIHPGSGSPKKCWPIERFLAVMNALQNDGRSGVLVTGEAEERMEAGLRGITFPAGWRWLRRPGLFELAGLLRSGALYLGNDSGVTHLAAACGAEVVALFRKDLEAAWSPFGRAVVLSAGEAAGISVADVLAALSRHLSRSLR
ncbi:MAG: glycosyltransferase family 9 protein [Candidatus Aminicenantes bacterium]|nr:glycosyltransferase family 9 protein [Candidatus Aminicenantes bacterium]